MSDRTNHTPEQLAEIANRVDEVIREDFRLTLARKALRASKDAAENCNTDHEAARQWGRLEVIVEQLLQLIDERAERDAALEAASRKPFDDLARTAAEIEAERGARGER
jgi:hypothetical protein